MAAAIRQHFREIRMLVGVSSAAQSKLVCPPPAFLHNPSEIIQGHMVLADLRPALIAVDSCFLAQSAFPVAAAPHDADVQKLREVCPERVDARILSVF